MAYTSRFTFIGEPLISKDKDSFLKEWKGGRDKTLDMAKIHFGVKEGKFNTCYVDCFGCVYESIRVGYENDKPIEVKWADRFDEDILKEVPRYRKYITDLDGTEHEFLSQYDFIKYLGEHLPEYKGKVECRGRLVKNIYEGKIYDRYELDFVKATSDINNKLEVTMDLFYNKDCVDLSEFDSKHRITLNAYTKQYVNRDEGEKFFPQNVVLDISKTIEAGTEKALAFGKLMASKVNCKVAEVMHIPWSCKIIRGAESVEFDESMLTDAQKEQIAFGLATLDDFNRQTYGENIYELRLIRQELHGDFNNGPIESGLSMDELEAQLFTMPEKASETMADIEKAVEVATSDSDSVLEGLLG